MVISLSDGKVIFATSLLGEFTLTLCSFSQIPSFSKTIILSRKWGNICKCGSCLGLLLTLARPHPHTLLCMKELPGWGKLSKGPRFKARTGCRAGPERRARLWGHSCLGFLWWLEGLALAVRMLKWGLWRPVGEKTNAMCSLTLGPRLW